MTPSGRIAVIGAGITGVTTALELIERGNDVVVFDRAAPGAGTSSAANGAITPYSDETMPAAVVALAEDSLTNYPRHLSRLRELSSTPVPYDTGGVLQLILDTDDHDVARREFARLAGAGHPVEWLSAGEALAAEPRVTQRTTGAIHFTKETRIDVSMLIEATIQSLRRLGCTFSYPTNVFRVSPSQEYVNVQTTVGPSNFDGAVVATGGNLGIIEGMPDIGIDKIRGEIVEVLGPPGLINSCLYRADSFITPRRDGRLLLGTSYVKHSDGMDTNRSTVSVQGALKKLVGGCEILPCLGDCQLSRVWKGWRPTSPDLIPIVGRWANNIVVADGLGGLGYTLALAVAKHVSNLITEPAAADYEILSPSRFAKSQA